jgi:SnoaL-like protein
MSYIEALDDQKYEGALGFLHDDVRIRGPAGETYGKPTNFIEMLRKYRGKYEVKRVFVDGADVCVLYDLTFGGSAVYMSSWYQVRDGKIASIHTVFDPSAMGPRSGNNSVQSASR